MQTKAHRNSKKAFSNPKSDATWLAIMLYLRNNLLMLTALRDHRADGIQDPRILRTQSWTGVFDEIIIIRRQRRLEAFT